MRCTRQLLGLLVVAAIRPHSLANAQSGLRASLDALHLASDSGRTKAIYAAGDEARARQIRALTDPMLDFYKARFGLTINVAIAVLDSANWSQLRGTLAPFPIPFVTDSPSVAVIALNPLSTAESNGLRDVRVAPPMPAAAAATVLSFGRNPERMIDLVVLSADARAIHEMGHRFSAAYGIATPRRWMSEFLANYWQQAFMSEQFPALTQFSLVMSKAMPLQTVVTYTTLADFERLSGPPAIPADNYAWYQDALMTRVIDVYSQRGVGFLTQMRDAFPRSEAGRLDDAEILRRLEGISPGWREWMASFGADRRR